MTDVLSTEAAGSTGANSSDRSAPRSRVVDVLLKVALVVLAAGVIDSVTDVLPDDDSVGSMHALQAEAWLDGELELGRSVEDVAEYDGKVYSPYPPAPALVLLPLVAVFGLNGPLPTLAALGMSALAVWFAWRICQRVGLARTPTLMLLLGLFLGTAYWACVLSSAEVWFFAHVVAVTFLLGAFDSALRGRALATGLFLGAAVLSRQMMIFALPFLVALLLEAPEGNGNGDGDDAPPDRRCNALQVALFAAPFLVLVAAYCMLNAARFSGPFDTGYSSIDLSGFLETRVDKYGLFNPAYVPFNVEHMFLQGFQLDYTGDQHLTVEGTDPFGTSLTIASPFLFFAFLARGRQRLLVAAWASIGLCLLGQLLYYNNGYAQTNAQRFSLDFVPMLFVLLVWGVQRAKTRLWQAAAAFAVALNFFAFVVVPRLDYVDRLFGVEDTVQVEEGSPAPL